MSIIFAINCFNNGKVNCTIRQNCLLWNGRQMRIFKDKGQAECSELSFQQGKLIETALQLQPLAEILGMSTHSIQTEGIVPNHRALTTPTNPKQTAPYWTLCDVLCLHCGVATDTQGFQLPLRACRTCFQTAQDSSQGLVQFISWLILCTTRTLSLCCCLNLSARCCSVVRPGTK